MFPCTFINISSLNYCKYEEDSVVFDILQKETEAKRDPWWPKFTQAGSARSWLLAPHPLFLTLHHATSPNVLFSIDCVQALKI